MKNRQYKFVIVLALAFSACNRSSDTPIVAEFKATSDEQRVASPKPSATAIPSATNTPTQTSTPTATQTSTPTQTFTPIPTATAAFNLPGFYYSGGCVTYNIMRGHVDFCVTSVEIRNDSKMVFNVSWTVHIPTPQDPATKGSDSGNRRMYLTDNLGNVYHHFDTGGCARFQRRFDKVVDTCYGYFVFSAAKQGANWFIFHDENNMATIGRIMMMFIPTPTPRPTSTIPPIFPP